MARKTKVVVICDRHRGADVGAVASVELVVDGDRHKLDLCAEHLAEFRKVARSWTGSSKAPARRRGAAAKPAGRPRSRAASSARRSEAAAIREWATANGHELSPRGRIPSSVREAYAAASG